MGTHALKHEGLFGCHPKSIVPLRLKNQRRRTAFFCLSYQGGLYIAALAKLCERGIGILS